MKKIAAVPAYSIKSDGLCRYNSLEKRNAGLSRQQTKTGTLVCAGEKILTMAFPYPTREYSSVPLLGSHPYSPAFRSDANK